jgi:hypothetical protein
VRDGFLERPQAAGAATAIDPEARRQWQIHGPGRRTTTRAS